MLVKLARLGTLLPGATCSSDTKNDFGAHHTIVANDLVSKKFKTSPQLIMFLKPAGRLEVEGSLMDEG